jgi:hypothetical protein
MASHFKWYPSETEVVVPFNARYSFPSQANKAVKMTPRISPKTGFDYIEGGTIRLEFPAQGYVNPANTTIAFDVELTDWTTPGGSITRFQNNIQSLFSRVRLLYGSTPIEDIINYNQIVRCLTEWTGTTQIGTMDQSSISDGIGGVVLGSEGYQDLLSTDQRARVTYRQGLVNIRQAYIQGIDNSRNTSTDITATANYSTVDTMTCRLLKGNGLGPIPNKTNASGPITTVRRYQVNLALGMFTQEKLIPTKFMASQLAIEITLEKNEACIFTQKHAGTAGASDTTGTPPKYRIFNVSLIPEILEFDASYDAMFLKGLQEGGVPIKFSSWHTFMFNTAGSNTLNLQIQERSRSVKALFAIQRRAPYSMETDSGAMLFCSYPSARESDPANYQNTLQSYQFRIGGRYFPAAPVQTSLSSGSKISNGGAEAFVELQKALNIVGDYRLSTGANAAKWALSPFRETLRVGNFPTIYSESDYAFSMTDIHDSGNPFCTKITYPGSAASSVSTDPSCFSGNFGSQVFCMAVDLETSNGVEISGLNAEEQSDISLIATYADAQNEKFNLEVYCYYDAMIILRENNVLDLIL